MIEGVDALSIFKTNLCRFLGGDCVDGKCFLVKKQKYGLEAGDFAISLNEAAFRRHFKKSVQNAGNGAPAEVDGANRPGNSGSQVESRHDPQNPEKFVPVLIKQSNEWLLKIDKCVVVGEHEKLYVYLKREHTYRTLLQLILNQGSLFGKNHHKDGEVVITTDISLEDQWKLNLSDYRVYLVATVLERLLYETGHSVTLLQNMEKDQIKAFEATHIHISATQKRDEGSKCISVTCGAVLNVKKGSKENDVTAKDYLRHKRDHLKEMSQHKYGDAEVEASWGPFVRKLAEATIRMDLLNIRPTCAVSLDVDMQSDVHKSDRSASFILYNCARLATLRRKFYKMCFEKQYPSLIPFEEVDFSLLVKDEEWELLSCYLLLYPSIVQSTTEYLKDGKPSPNLLCNFLYCFIICYSRYYRRVRILTEPHAHLFPVMFARLYLLQAVEQVLHNGLRLLGIEPVTRM